MSGQWTKIVVHAGHLTRLPVGEYGPARHVVGGLSITAEQGRQKWMVFHQRGLLFQGRDDTVWLAQFARSLPCGECRSHFLAMLARTPPDWANYFRWTVDLHNEVNVRLGKPEMSLEQAEAIWQAAKS